MQQEKTLTEQYFDSDDAFKFYNILNGIDYTGIGSYDQETTAKNENGEDYVIGAGITINEATKKRDQAVLDIILKHAP